MEGVDILKLAIGPEEAFVLSRIDGRSSQQDIVFATGLPDQRVAQALARLAELGAITWEVTMASTSATAMRLTKPSNAYPQTAQVEPVDVLGIQTAGDSGAPPYDPKELEGEYDLDVDKRRLVLDRFYRNDSLSHYDTLGVSRGADRKAIKTAYYDLVAAIHPDKYFGRNIGHFRKKMEHCFARITEAYDVLSRQTTRQEYDAYLISQQQVADLQRALDMHVTADELDRLEADLMRLADNVTSSMPPAEAGTQVPAPNAVSSNTQTVRVLTDQERRQALANALRRSAPGARVSSGASSPSAPVSSPDMSTAADRLRHHYESRLRHAQQLKLKSHLQAAKDALNRNDPVTACNDLRFAQRLAPDDKSIAVHLAEVQVQANSVLADRYLEQAKYEERHGRFETASRNFSLAAQARPNADLWERAARCALDAKTDLRSAAEMAKKALEFDPERVSLHALLAEVYIEAQLNASAAAELERAARLAPNDDSIRELRRRLERRGT